AQFNIVAADRDDHLVQWRIRQRMMVGLEPFEVLERLLELLLALADIVVAEPGKERPGHGPAHQELGTHPALMRFTWGEPADVLPGNRLPGQADRQYLGDVDA